jgi:hypothetical protein
MVFKIMNQKVVSDFSSSNSLLQALVYVIEEHDLGRYFSLAL